LILEIESLDSEGRGVARNEGKVVFVEGALPGERVRVDNLRRGARFDLARTTAVERASAGRREPRCDWFGLCGGCATQHADTRTQMAAKQRWLEENFARIGKVEPEVLLPIVYGMEWGYRSRARMSAHRVVKKGGTLVGFRERRSKYVTDMQSCEVLPARISRLIPTLRALVESLSIRARLPQIEVVATDASDVLVIRHLDPLTDDDFEKLRAFADQADVQVWLQPKGPDSAHPFHPDQAANLAYSLPEFGVDIAFGPTDFTQVNVDVNRLLVSRALRLLDPQPGERIGDLYCGVGNFSLPIAARGAQVIGLEGSAALVERARANAAANRLTAQFETADLYKPDLARFGQFDKLLLDPPRDGARAVVESLSRDWPRRIVYVSCDPATLARDAGLLVHDKGFRLAAAGVVNMFPHTMHVESIALFDR
jgi:23S rRNA (uracil1939-C5)-methyltransferase